MTEELTWAPAWRLSELIRSKEVSPVEVLDHFLGRIEQFEPELKAFDHLDPAGSRQAAKEAEAAVLAGDDLGPLHGIPTAVKCHIDIEGVPETMPFGAGIARRDHPVIRACATQERSSSGTRRCRHSPPTSPSTASPAPATRGTPRRTPGISSAGTAAAVTAGLLPVAIGSDGGGSVTSPGRLLGLHRDAHDSRARAMGRFPRADDELHVDHRPGGA